MAKVTLTADEERDAIAFLATHPAGEVVIERGESLGYRWSPATVFDPPIHVRMRNGQLQAEVKSH